MSKKKKLIISLTSIALVVLLITGIAVNNKIKTPVFVDEETEFIVTNIMLMYYGECTKQNIQRVRYPIRSFGGWGILKINEEGEYYVYSEQHPDKLYMNEEFLEFPLWFYTHQTGEISTIEEIEECIYEGNKEKNVAVYAYVDWYYGGGGAYIDEYSDEYGEQTGKAFSQATLAEKQQFVLEQEAKQKQEEQENSTNE